jgi:hypothetical protein
VFVDKCDGLSATVTSSVALQARAVAWDSWEARETMLMAMSSVVRPLKRDSFLQWFLSQLGHPLASIVTFQSRTWPAQFVVQSSPFSGRGRRPQDTSTHGR